MGHPVWVRKKAKTRVDRGHVSLGCPKILEVPKSCAREKVGHPVTPARKVVARYAPSSFWEPRTPRQLAVYKPSSSVGWSARDPATREALP